MPVAAPATRTCMRAKCRIEFVPDHKDKYWCVPCRVEAATRAYDAHQRRIRREQQVVTARSRMADRRDPGVDPGWARRLESGHELLSFHGDDDSWVWWWFTDANHPKN